MWLSLSTQRMRANRPLGHYAWKSDVRPARCMLRSTMTLPRMTWHLVGFPGIVLFTWTTLVVAQQVKMIDGKALKTAGKSTEWTINGMDWGERRYSTMTQINPGNVSKLGSAWSYEL